MTSVRAEVFGVLKTLGIEEARDQSALEDDLALDSQGIVDLTCELEARLGIRIPDDAIRRSDTVEQVLGLAQRLHDEAGGANGQAAASSQITTDSEGGLVEQISIAAPVNVVYKCLHDVADWPRRLPHVDAIDIIYDDGRYQEFYMGVKDVARVRSIRKCEADEIVFFQPEPPAFFTRHSGGWKFEAKGPAEMMLTASHRWTLSDKAAVKFPPSEGLTTEQQVENMMRSHALSVMSTWKQLIEAGGAGD